MLNHYPGKTEFKFIAFKEVEWAALTVYTNMHDHDTFKDSIVGSTCTADEIHCCAGSTKTCGLKSWLHDDKCDDGVL